MTTETPRQLPDRQTSGRALASGITYLLIAGMGTNACLFLMNLAIIHAYGPTIHGQVVWIFAAAWIAVGLSDFGIASAAAARSIARRRAGQEADLGRTVAAWMSLQVLLGLVAAAVLAALAGPISELCIGVGPGEIRIAATWVLCVTGLRACAMVAVGFEAMRETLLMMPVAELARLLVVLVGWLAGAPITWVLIGWAGCYAVALLVAIWRVGVLTRRAGVAVKLSAIRPARLLASTREALPYYVPFMGLFCLPFAMRMILGAWGPQENIRQDLSVFHVCFSLAMVVRLISGPISGAILPRVAHIDASHADHTQTGDILRQSARLLGTVSTLLLAGAVTAGVVALRLVYGPAYAAAIDTFLILIAFAAIDSYAMPLDQILKAMHHVGIVAMLEVTRYAIMLAVGWWAISAHGPLGAAWAILAGSLATVLVKMLAARGRVTGLGAGAFAATGAIIAMLVAIHLLGWGLWLALPAWLTAVLATKLLRPTELARWAAIIRESLRPASGRP